MNHRLELILVLAATHAWKMAHNCTHVRAHTHTLKQSPLVLLSDTQTVRAADELSVSLSVLVTTEINNPTGQ